MPFSQIYNNDNGSVVVLAPSRPWQKRGRFAVAKPIAIALNGSRPAVNVARMGGEGTGWVYTPFATFDSMTCANDRRDGAPSPLPAAEVLWGGGHHRYSLTYATT